MNTNSKHYEELNIQPWEIMERNFTTEEFVAYLKGNIIKYTLRDKGQALTDAQKIKHYAEKLIEVLETQENWTITGVKPEEVEDKYLIAEGSKFKVGDRVRLKYLEGQNGTIIRQPVLGLREVDEENYIVELDEGEEGWKANKREHLVDCERAWYVDDDEIELLEETEDKHKFKVGDRVRVISYDEEGTIIRTPVKTLKVVDKDSYIVELDTEDSGWTATKEKHGVDSQNAWYVSEHNMELLSKKTLKPYKWYDAEDFTPVELTELLPIGTTVLVTKWHDNNRTVDLEEEETLLSEITNVGKRHIEHDTRVGVKGDCLWRRYFKIVEEN